jgi:hypothetical protein
MGARIKHVLEAFAPGGAAVDLDRDKFAQFVNKTYKRMSDGHHLDGLALVRTGDPNDPGYYLGAGYDRSLVSEALYHGTKMTGILALTTAIHMSPLNPQRGALIPQIDAAMKDVLALIPDREEGNEEPTSSKQVPLV